MKKICGILLLMVFSFALLPGCSSGEVDEPCMYCSARPSKAYQKSDGETVYVCSECSSTCMFCGEKATRQYETLLGVAFACDDCYNDL